MQIEYCTQYLTVHVCELAVYSYNSIVGPMFDVNGVTFDVDYAILKMLYINFYIKFLS